MRAAHSDAALTSRYTSRSIMLIFWRPACGTHRRGPHTSLYIQINDVDFARTCVWHTATWPSQVSISQDQWCKSFKDLRVAHSDAALTGLYTSISMIIIATQPSTVSVYICTPLILTFHGPACGTERRGPHMSLSIYSHHSYWHLKDMLAACGHTPLRSSLSTSTHWYWSFKHLRAATWSLRISL